MDSIDIGSTIRKFRTEKGMSLKELAEEAQVTSSLLSQIERGQANPSLNTIRLISSALDIPLFKFFIEEQKEERFQVIHKEDRKHLVDQGVDYELLTPDRNTEIEFMMLRLQPGMSTITKEPNAHRGEEVAVLVKGKLELQLEEETFALKECDSVHILPNTRHGWMNRGTEEAILVFAITPPEF